VHAPHVFGGTHGTSRPLSGQDAPIPSGAQFAVDDPKFRIQPIQDSKAVWIDNMDATHGTFRHWAMGLCTVTVDGGIFIHNISVDTRNIATSN
jgi:hypothetical protein